MGTSELTSEDLARLEARGIDEAEAARQLERLRRPPVYQELVRPATVGDGIVRLDERAAVELHAEHAEAARAGRFTKFVPASGAASRMFRDLLWYQRGPGREQTWNEVRRRAGAGDHRAAALLRFVEELPRFAFAGELRRALEQRGEDPEGLAATGAFQPILDALLEPDGLHYDARPKGLIPFHAAPDGAEGEACTPLEEHLDEAAAYVRDAGGRCRLHFTVSPEHMAGFERRFARVEAAFNRRWEARYDIRYSMQRPSTDTLATDGEGRPLRDDAGQLVLRPGGHGALIGNLDGLGGDLIYVKNIDNVQPAWRRGPTVHWKRTLGGLAARLQRQVHEHLQRLRRAQPAHAELDAALRFAREELALGEPDAAPAPEALRALLLDRLNRPLRVCGVVPNTGEPGGGPFWVRHAGGSVRLQIVERAQVDPGDEAQQRILGEATHFNPVDLVCAVRDPDGHVHDLQRWVDPEAAIVTRKSQGGRDLVALEQPGLWNGAMARWNTVLVEVPLATFSPVKTVLDLLRPEHQPGDGSQNRV